MKRTIAIGDIHGCATTFLELLAKLDISTDDEIYLLGDYIDRGRSSRGVIHTIFALQQSNFKVHCLRGNHEQMLMDSEDSTTNFFHYVRHGGDKTLESFGVDSFSEMHQAHQDFFTNTKLFFETDKYIFVHAGLNFRLDNIMEDEESMLWERNFSNHQPKLGNKIMVHGHTPINIEDIVNQNGNCINIDGGCVYKTVAGKGYLVALILETMEYVYLKNIEE